MARWLGLPEGRGDLRRRKWPDREVNSKRNSNVNCRCKCDVVSETGPTRTLTLQCVARQVCLLSCSPRPPSAVSGSLTGRMELLPRIEARTEGAHSSAGAPPCPPFPPPSKPAAASSETSRACRRDPRVPECQRGAIWPVTHPLPPQPIPSPPVSRMVIASHPVIPSWVIAGGQSSNTHPPPGRASP